MKTPIIAPVVPHTPGSWRFLYFDAPTRGEQVRMLFFLASTPFDDVRLKFPEGLTPYKTAAMGDASPLLGTDQCPAVTDPSGVHCVETSDIMKFVGRQVGMAPPEGSAADAKATEMCLLAQTALNECFYKLLLPMVVSTILRGELYGILSWVPRLVFGRERALAQAPAAKLAEILATVEAALVESGGPFVCGQALNFADVSLYAVLFEIFALPCLDRTVLLAPHPKVAGHFEALGERMAPWMEQRVREHQVGIPNTVEWLAATNTPVPSFLSKMRKH